MHEGADNVTYVKDRNAGGLSCKAEAVGCCCCGHRASHAHILAWPGRLGPYGAARAAGMLRRRRPSTAHTRLKEPVPDPVKPAGHVGTQMPSCRYCSFLQRTQVPLEPFQLQVWQSASVAAQVQPTSVVLVVRPMQSSSRASGLSGMHSRLNAPVPAPL